jgi:hypothetical protein
MRRKTLWSRALLVGLWLLPVGVAAEGKSKEDYSKLAGYVDFAQLGLEEEEAVVEVYLHDALLNMVASMSRGSDPELADMLGKLKLIRVQKFLLEDDAKVGSVEEQISALAGRLEKSGWVAAVRMREKRGENVYVYLKMGDTLLQGVTVMAVEEGESATFVNIVGEIDPEQVGRLGRKFDIDELDELGDHWNERSHDKKSEKK